MLAAHAGPELPLPLEHYRDLDELLMIFNK
jgi:hypothetical protein